MNLNDGGMGSLRQAIMDTPAGGTVDFQPGLTGTITLTSGELAISKNLTISGPGADVITVSGNQASRVFDITGSVSVAISGLTIANGLVIGEPAQGGGIFNSPLSTLTVTGSTLRGNSTSAGVTSEGGGIFNSGTLTVTGSTISGNSAVAGFFGDGWGGGIFNGNGGTLTVTGSTISGNSASAGLGLGGGIFSSATGTSILIVTDSTISGNSASSFASGVLNGCTATVTDSTFSGNTGLVIENDGTLMTITDSTLIGGIHNNPGTLIVTGSPVSGGISNAGTLAVTDSTLSGGISNIGTLTVTDSTLSGGISNYSFDTFVGTLTVTDSALSGAIFNASLFAVRGQVTIDGDYFQTATGTLDVRIGGTQAGTDYDQLVVNGLATLAGTLQITLLNGYQPQPGDQFQPLLFGSGSGTFAHYTGGASGFSFLYVYDNGGFLPPGLTLVAN
jgi:hypothetical protein